MAGVAPCRSCSIDLSQVKQENTCVFITCDRVIHRCRQRPCRIAWKFYSGKNGGVVNTGSQQSSAHRFLTQWFRHETMTRALKIAGVVGPILTLINQYDVLLRLEFSFRFWMKVLLTFSVPYCVSSFSSARAYMEQKRREQGTESRAQ
jgi:hypothetical protein